MIFLDSKKFLIKHLFSISSAILFFGLAEFSHALASSNGTLNAEDVQLFTCRSNLNGDRELKVRVDSLGQLMAIQFYNIDTDGAIEPEWMTLNLLSKSKDYSNKAIYQSQGDSNDLGVIVERFRGSKPAELRIFSLKYGAHTYFEIYSCH